MHGVMLGSDGNDGKDEQEMLQQFLAGKGTHVPVSTTCLEVLSLFEDAKAGTIEHFKDDIKTSAKFPVKPTGSSTASITSWL